MKKNLKKWVKVFALAAVLLFSFTACSTEKLDNQAEKSADSDSWMADEKEDKADKPDTDKAESAKADDEIKAEDDAYFDVDSSPDKEVDYSKYDEKKVKPQNGTSGNVTYSDGSGSGQDEYLTDPVPEGQQNPVEPEDAQVDTSKSYTCYLSISCATILDNMGDLTEGKEDLVPSDGMIFSQRAVTFYEGESVFDVLQRETRNNRIHMEFTMTPKYNSAYIEGINNLYEFDCGQYSGWMYCVNGWYPNYGVSRYAVQPGDVIEFNYTCDLGRDLGQDWIG